MRKINKLINRLFKRGTTAANNNPAIQDAASCPPGEPLKCLDGKLYRMRLRNGRWETFGPPLGDCKEED
jgi:hypothetical protein